MCQSSPIPKADVEFINECIKNEYALNWVVDGLPAAHLSKDERTNEEYYSIGFALGSNVNNKPELNNHYDITIDYHPREDKKYRVVGVLVTPYSRNQKLVDGHLVKGSGPLVLGSNEEVVYTYSVKWNVSKQTHTFLYGIIYHESF